MKIYSDLRGLDILCISQPHAIIWSIITIAKFSNLIGYQPFWFIRLRGRLSLLITPIHDYRPNWTPLSPIIICNNRLIITKHILFSNPDKICFIGFCFICSLKDFPCHVVQKGEATMDCDKDCDAFKASQVKLASKEDEIRKEKERKAQQVINSSLLSPTTDASANSLLLFVRLSGKNYLF